MSFIGAPVGAAAVTRIDAPEGDGVLATAMTASVMTTSAMRLDR
jgi:hypothetical protein